MRKEIFGELYAQNSRKICKVLYCLGYSYNDIEDIMQDSFLIAYEKWSQLKNIEVFDKWCIKIAINVAKRKSNRAKTEVLLENPEGIKLLLEKFDLENYCFDFDDAIYMAVEEEVKKLPSVYGHPFCLFVVDEYSYRDISTMLEVKMGTVKSRIFRAKVILRTHLNDRTMMQEQYLTLDNAR